MSRVVATASLTVLLLSILAFANCRILETVSDADAVVVLDEQRTPNPVVSGEVDAAQVIPTTTPVEEGFFQLISHQRNHRRPCHHVRGLFHQRLWRAHHDGLPHGHGDSRVHNLAVVPTELEKKNQVPVEAVAEPDPDSHPDSDGEHEVEEETMKPFHRDEAEVGDDELTKAWKGEMLRRFRHGLHFHHRHHIQHHQHDDEDHTEHNKEGDGAVKRLLHSHHHDDNEEMTDKRFHGDSDREDDEEAEEKTARHWRKGHHEGEGVRGMFHHGRRHHHHRHAEEDEKKGGVMNLFFDLMDRF